jgi:DNA primase
VVNYLKGRGLTGEIARDFRIGFAPAGWDNLMQANGADEAAQDLLMRSGMLVKNDKGRTYDRFRERVIFPNTGPARPGDCLWRPRAGG